MQGWFNTQINKWDTTIAEERIKIIGLFHRYRKAFEKTQHLFLVKTYNKLSIEGM
jgi:hypothetical protein